ncbi:MAG TPA: alpha-amylase family protein [Candidatus Acidoferrum sp.]|nr:alpha-amylase family protein [Candidatus Acidoferrum sp.]
MKPSVFALNHKPLGFLLFWLALAGLPPLNAQQAAPAPTRWETRAKQKTDLNQGITWLTHEPIDFLMRRGDHYDDEPDRYQKMCAPDNLKRMADAGIRYGRIFFYKGFGREYERANMEQAKATAALMHQFGLKVDIYIGGTMFAETLYCERPEARNWEQRDQNNQWVPYGLQTFRHYACPNEPAYRDYLKSILKYAVEEVHADQISFDNIMLQPEPESCRCPRCITAFHDFLRRHYPTPETVRRRFGLPDVEWIQPNEWASPTQPDGISVLNDPVLQEWVRFRCESLAHYANDLYDYVKSLNPDVSVLFNIKGLYSYNRYWANAVYHPLFANRIDVLSFDTGGYDARIDARTGALVSQIRFYKVARRLKTSCEEPLQDDLRCAVDMAFAYQTPVRGNPGSPFTTHVSTPLLEFYREYLDRYYRDTESVADVAVLHTWPSMAYSISDTYVPTTLMEQVLIQHQIPFDILFDEDLERIGSYQEIILPGQECVGEAQAQKLLEYARNGGTLLLTGNTAQYNQWRERRRTNPFLPARTERKGRIIYLPEIIPADSPGARVPMADENPEPGAAPQRGARMSPAQWVLPKNHEAISQAVVQGLPRGLSIRTEAPLTAVMDLLTRPRSRETLVHFVNFDRANPLAPLPTTVRKQFDGTVKSVTLLSPERDAPQPLSFRESADQVTFTVPAAKRYALVVIAQ